MAVAAPRNLAPLDLFRFRRRIRLLRAWRAAALGGCAGAALGLLLLVADWQDVWDTRPWQLAALIGLGAVVAAASSLLERYSDAQVARSIDRRQSGLQDSVTTAFEAQPAYGASGAAPLFLPAARQDAACRLKSVQPARLYPLRVARIHWALLAMIAACAVGYLVLDTPLLHSAAARSEAAGLKKAAVQVAVVARPFIAQARAPGATAADKQLAHDLQRFTQDLQKGRMTRQQALIRANQLAEQARSLQAQRTLALSQTLNHAQTAGQRLEQLADQGTLQKTSAAKLAAQESSLQQQLARLQQQLAAATAQQGKPGQGQSQSAASKARQKALQQQIAALQKKLQQIQLSRQAQATFEKLATLPQYQEAMRLLAKLQTQASAQQSGQAQPLTPEQMRQIAQRLEQLAKQLQSDAAMKAYAQALLDAAKQAKMLQPGQAAVAIQGAMGMGGTSSTPHAGAGAPSEDIWTGDHGTLHHSDKSSLLHIKFSDRTIQSQQGKSGPESYTEEIGPAKLGPKSGIPYQAVLPKYEKSAESALNKSDVPPAMRTRVRDYFDSLHQGQ